MDRVIELESGARIVATKIFGPEEDFFRGHFPGNPIVPGVIIIEAMAQTGGVLVYSSFTEEIKAAGQSGAYLAGLEKVKFRKVVYPNDELKMDVRIAKRRSKLIKFECEAWVGDSKVTEAEITVSLY